MHELSFSSVLNPDEVLVCEEIIRTRAILKLTAPKNPCISQATAVQISWQVLAAGLLVHIKLKSCKLKFALTFLCFMPEFALTFSRFMSIFALSFWN
jgi:hypothetical protein